MITYLITYEIDGIVNLVSFKNSKIILSRIPSKKVEK